MTDNRSLDLIVVQFVHIVRSIGHLKTVAMIIWMMQMLEQHVQLINVATHTLERYVQYRQRTRWNDMFNIISVAPHSLEHYVQDDQLGSLELEQLELELEQLARDRDRDRGIGIKSNQIAGAGAGAGA